MLKRGEDHAAVRPGPGPVGDQGTPHSPSGRAAAHEPGGAGSAVSPAGPGVSGSPTSTAAAPVSASTPVSSAAGGSAPSATVKDEADGYDGDGDGDDGGNGDSVADVDADADADADRRRTAGNIASGNPADSLSDAASAAAVAGGTGRFGSSVASSPETEVAAVDPADSHAASGKDDAQPGDGGGMDTGTG